MRLAAAAFALAFVPFSALAQTAPSAADDATRAANAAMLDELALADREDFDFASRGFIATREDPLIKAEDGRTVWDLNAYNFLAANGADTVNPSLWRQAQLLSKHGLFQVSERIFQVRGFDVSNVTIIEGDTGLILIDPLTTVETAKAALELYRKHRGDKPVKALIYTHSHADHFGGARGVVDQKDLDSGAVQVIAPEGFLEHAVSENVLAGIAMSRRASFQFGVYLPRGLQGQVSSGIGQAIPAGSQSLIPPTRSIAKTGETLTIDGVRLEFQITPGTEAPAELNIYLPDLHALCLAENANASMHNVLTPRGALVRDAKVWADYLSESAKLYAARSDVMFTSHAWPRWGKETISSYLSLHRDAYKYLHDQSVRMMNNGMTGEEIAETIKLPPTLASAWFNRGYYGTMKFNSKAVYQRYMGWYDGNPAHLDPLPPEQSSKRYIEAMGGAKKVLALAQKASKAGDYRWSAQLLNHLVFAEPDNKAAREALVHAYEQLAFQAESAIWRNMYLTGAMELRDGVKANPAGGAGALDLIRNTPTPMLFDLMAVRLNPEKAKNAKFSMILAFPERNERTKLTVENDVLLHEPADANTAADATFTMPRAVFLMHMLTAAPLKPEDAQVIGDAALFGKFADMLDRPAPNFPIVTP